jgi:hypothetical protein
MDSDGTENVEFRPNPIHPVSGLVRARREGVSQEPLPLCASAPKQIGEANKMTSRSGKAEVGE